MNLSEISFDTSSLARRMGLAREIKMMAGHALERNDFDLVRQCIGIVDNIWKGQPPRLNMTPTLPPTPHHHRTVERIEWFARQLLMRRDRARVVGWLYKHAKVEPNHAADPLWLLCRFVPCRFATKSKRRDPFEINQIGYDHVCGYYALFYVDSNEASKEEIARGVTDHDAAWACAAIGIKALEDNLYIQDPQRHYELECFIADRLVEIWTGAQAVTT